MELARKFTIWSGITSLVGYAVSAVVGITAVNDFSGGLGNGFPGSGGAPDMSAFGFASFIGVIAGIAFWVAIVAGIVWIVQYLSMSKQPSINNGTIVHGGSGDTVVLGQGARRNTVNTGKGVVVGGDINDSDFSNALTELHIALQDASLPTATKGRAADLANQIDSGIQAGAPKTQTRTKVRELTEVLKGAGDAGKVALEALTLLKALLK